MSNDLQLTGERGLRAIAERALELQKNPPAVRSPRERAEGMSDHMHALYRFGMGRDQMPEPTRENAIAVHEAYYMLLDENERLRREVGAERMYARMVALVEQCPALARWRERVLESAKQPPLARAAAWELTGLLEELEGNALDAEFARLYAEEAIASAKPARTEVAA